MLYRYIGSKNDPICGYPQLISESILVIF